MPGLERPEDFPEENMRRAVLVFAAVFCLGLGAAAPARAQQQAQPKLYTYVAEWGVPRAQWGEMNKYMESLKPTFDKLVDDGTLTGYGYGAVEVHQPGGMTHFNWMQASSVAGILKALGTVGAALTPNPVLAASKHADFFYQSTLYGGKAGSFQNGYMWLGHFKLQPGKTGDWIGMFHRFVRPILDGLVADGTILAYQLDTPQVHTPGSNDTLNYSFISAGPDGIDKFFAAVSKAEAANPFIGPALDPIEAPAGHFDMIAAVPMMRRK
jgi:hypothetical protein